MSLSLLPRIRVACIPDVPPSAPHPRGKRNMHLEDAELFFARHLQPRQMPSGSGVNVALGELRLRLHEALHAVVEGTGQQPTKVCDRTRHRVGDASAGLELILLELLGGHLLDVLLVKYAGSAITLARTAVGDGLAVGDAVLALRRDDVAMKRAHRVAGARVLLLRVVRLAGLLGRRLVALLEELQLPLVRFVECRLLPS